VSCHCPEPLCCFPRTGNGLRCHSLFPIVFGDKSFRQSDSLMVRIPAGNVRFAWDRSQIMVFPFPRGNKAFERKLSRRSKLVLEVWLNAGWLRKDKLLGTANVPLAGLTTKAEIHESVRTPHVGGRLPVTIPSLPPRSTAGSPIVPSCRSMPRYATTTAH